GCGHWGRNLVRIFHHLGALSGVVIRSESGATAANEVAPGAVVHRAFDAVLSDRAISGVVIATPAQTHVSLCEAALRAGKDVFCEKPFALSHDDARRLADLARDRDRILMVGHVLEYHPAISKLRELISRGDLGD